MTAVCKKTMATINVAAVRGRYRAMFDSLRKDVAKMLEQIRAFYSLVSKPKKSQQGRAITRGQITAQLPNTVEEARDLELLMKQVTLNAEHCAFDLTDTESVLWLLQEYTKGVVNRTYHLGAKFNNSVKRAERSVVAHGGETLQLIDKARAANRVFGAAVKEYLQSDGFADAARDPHSDVVVKENEITGTDEEREALLLLMDEDLLTEKKEEELALAALIDKAEIEANPEACKAALGRHGDAQNEEDSQSSEDEDICSDDLQDDSEDDDDDDDDDDESNSQENGEDDDGDEQPDGAADSADNGTGGETKMKTSEDEDKKSNKKKKNEEDEDDLSQTNIVEPEGIERNSRKLRKRQYRVIDLDLYSQMPDDLKVGEPAKRRRAPKTEAEEEAAEEAEILASEEADKAEFGDDDDDPPMIGVDADDDNDRGDSGSEAEEGNEDEDEAEEEDESLGQKMARRMKELEKERERMTKKK